MRILHIMPESVFTKPIAEFYNEYFDPNEHEICYIIKSGRPSLIRSDIDIVQKELIVEGKRYDVKEAMRLIRIMKQYDYIALHSMCISQVSRFMILMQRRILKKIVWIEWGYDLYTWNSYYRKNTIGRMATTINRQLRNQINWFVGIFPPDCEYFKKEFPKSKAKIYYAPYCGSKIDEEFYHYTNQARLSLTKQTDEPLYIQIGHNAQDTLHHIDVLNILSKWADKNVKIVLPLSYGDAEYADAVQKKAEEIFPGKTLCLRSFLPPNEYFNLIRRVDIAIFNTLRQCALGNIHRMIFRNTKLYLSETGTMYPYFKAQGIPVQKYEELCSCTFDDFIADVQIKDTDAFNTFITNLTDMEQSVKCWRIIYDALRKELNT